MQALINWLEGIGAVILAVVNFVISMFQDIVYVITLTGQVLTQIPTYFSWLPGEMVASLAILFAIVVLYKILGREG